MKSAEDQLRRRAKGEALRKMEAVASDGSTISYSQLTEAIDSLRYAPNGQPLSDLLCDISRASNAKRNVLLSAVVVHADDRLPGDGFFALAEELGYTVDDRYEFHRRALAEVHREYAKPN